MAPTILTTLLLALGLGVTLTFASSHWFMAWMGLEISTLAILPLMAQHRYPRAIEATTKYFLVQATGAATLLFAASTNAWLMGQWDIKQLDHPLPIILLTLALGLKMGLAPTHLWLPEVMQGLDLTTGLILSTWQKLAPFALLTQVCHLDSDLLVLIGLSSTILGGWGGLNQTQLRKVLAYSSIAHLGWMILVMQFSPSLAILALLSYIIMTSSTFLVFKLAAVTNVNTLASSWANAPALTALTPLLLLSLGGLPPLTGFTPKWLILQELTKQGLPPTATLAALSALLSLFFYLRLSYAMALTIPPNTPTATAPWRSPPLQLTLPLAISAIATIALLPLTPALTALLKL
uniref:NADH-ubiquinone oxidoreductase chain 2 n=1 Tax=Platycephalus cultellatus TaxID=1811512 RepID=A0A8K2ASB7_9TELE|nr:NADH dehydrogenase subunit 2 [Platycephalus cultellatus]UEX92606.1 NADH dehydrogenase subunit 2 [Platycephalus cultellatus]UKB88254.1 NADH dehydrogenase subunit 2 [Platycephalus cultellatus]WRI15781.1 NADH dehydrogenase subunit 2 [Platycephalus cultellatus]